MVYDSIVITYRGFWRFSRYNFSKFAYPNIFPLTHNIITFILYISYVPILHFVVLPLHSASLCRFSGVLKAAALVQSAFPCQ